MPHTRALTRYLRRRTPPVQTTDRVDLGDGHLSIGCSHAVRLTVSRGGDAAHELILALGLQIAFYYGMTGRFAVGRVFSGWELTADASARQPVG